MTAHALADCLPEALRGPGTTITPVAVGFSGACVHRVEATSGASYVLKVAPPDTPEAAFRRTLFVLRHAGEAGVAPRVVHVDDARRAVTSEFVEDRGFARWFRDPATHGSALAELGALVRRVHALPLPPDDPRRDGRDFLRATWTALAGYPVPPMLRDAAERLLREPPPDEARLPVLSHNDLNPSNVVFDGSRLLLFDWDMAGVNDPYYDLAVLSLFLRMDAPTALALLSAYDEAPVDALPARFLWNRRLAGTLAGAVFVRLAREAGHVGGMADPGIALGEIYRRMTTGAFDLRSADGQWAMGLALVREAHALGQG